MNFWVYRLSLENIKWDKEILTSHFIIWKMIIEIYKEVKLIMKILVEEDKRDHLWILYRILVKLQTGECLRIPMKNLLCKPRKQRSKNMPIEVYTRNLNGRKEGIVKVICYLKNIDMRSNHNTHIHIFYISF